MLRKIRTVLLMSMILLIIPSATLCAAEPMTLDDRAARISYSLGYQIGGDFKRQGVEMNSEAVVRGIEDALSGAEPLMPQKAMNGILLELKRKVVDDERKKMAQNRRQMELQYLEEGKKFMQENAAKPGVKTTTSGLQYRIIQTGKGKAPKPTDQVTVNYRGTLIDGNEFDSSYKNGQPASFPLNGVIKGWTEGLQLIREGGKIQLIIPPELAYGGRGPLAHRTLVFDVELLSVGDDKQAGSSVGGKQGGSAQRDRPQEKN